MVRTDSVDHLIFGNNQGMRVIASSVEDRVLLDKWQGLLDWFVRLETFQGLDPPPWALSYLRLDGGLVATIHRSGSPLTRVQAHVLIGQADVLTSLVALGLYHWGGWNMQGAPGVARH